MSFESMEIPTRNVYGIYLIDGNHVFLDCLNKHLQQLKKDINWVNSFSLEDERKRRQEILKNKSPEIIEEYYKDWDSDKRIKESYEWLSNESIPRSKKFNADDLVPHFAKYAHYFSNEFVKIFLKNLKFDFDKIFPNKFSLEKYLERKKIESIKAIFSENTIESFIFDADLPPKEKIIEWLTRDLDEAEKWNLSPKKDYLKNVLNNLDNNIWEFPFEKAILKAPFDTKTKFLNYLEENYAIHLKNKTKLIRGRKLVNSTNNYLSQREKEVDARLVIKGCEAARDSKIDYVCLITNDSDYVPLIQHLKKNNKEVFLMSLTHESIVSKHLKKEIGVKNCFNINNIDTKSSIDVEIGYQNFQDFAYWKKTEEDLINYWDQ